MRASLITVSLIPIGFSREGLDRFHSPFSIRLMAQPVLQPAFLSPAVPAPSTPKASLITTLPKVSRNTHVLYTF